MLERIITGAKDLARKGLIGATLVGAGLGLIPLKGAVVEAEAAAPAKIVTVIPYKGGAGVGGSKWYGALDLVNTSSTQTATGWVYILPQQDNDLATAARVPYEVAPRTNLRIQNLKEWADSHGIMLNYSNVSLRIEPTNDIAVGVLTDIRNKQNLKADLPEPSDPSYTVTTTTDLMQADTAIEEKDLLEPGDVALWRAPSVTPQEYAAGQTRPEHRMNVFIYGQGANPNLYCEMFRNDGTLDGTAFIDAPNNGGLQYTNAIEKVFNRTPQGGETIRCVNMNGGKTWIIPSIVKNNVDMNGVDDGDNIRPEISRLVEAQSYTAGPDVVETHNPVVLRAYTKTRQGSEIRGGTVDGAVSMQISGDNTTELKWSHTGFPTMPGTYQNSFTVGVHTNDGDFNRTVAGNQLVVIPETDCTPANSYTITKQNLDQIATLLGDNVNAVFLQNNTHYSKADMAAILQKYTNGTTGSQDPELDHVVIYDSTNKIDFHRTDGGTAIWGGLTEEQVQTLKDVYDCTQ